MNTLKYFTAVALLLLPACATVQPTVDDKIMAISRAYEYAYQDAVDYTNTPDFDNEKRKTIVRAFVKAGKAIDHMKDCRCDIEAAEAALRALEGVLD